MIFALASCGNDDGSQASGDAGVDGTFGIDAAVPIDSGRADASDAGSNDAAPPFDAGIDAGASVLQFHLNPSRDGHYVDPLMTPARAATMHMDTSFDGTVTGPVWSQPLYVEAGPRGKGIFLVASDSNDVYALDETTGTQVWHTNLGPPATTLGFANPNCGNVFPLGVTGTPVIDLGRRTAYLDSATGGDGGVLAHHWIHALSIDDGTERPGGWPIDVNLVSPQGATFEAQVESQRGALALVNGYLYVPYGGPLGDCGNYHGWVVSVPIANPVAASSYSTPALKGGMWATGGISSDGTDVFVASGNTYNTNGVWGGGEAVIRFHDGTYFDPTNTASYFYPSDWLALDEFDSDIGASNPIVFDAPGATPSKLAAQFSKSGVIYLLDRTNLGGPWDGGNGVTGEGVASAQIANNNDYQSIVNAGTAFTAPSGTYVVLWARGYGANCPPGQSGDLIGVKIGATSPPTLTTAWCQNVPADSGPIVTTTDGTSNPIVWQAGANGDLKLHGVNGETGAIVFDGGQVSDVMHVINHFTAPIDVKGRIFVGATDRLYAFKGP